MKSNFFHCYLLRSSNVNFQASSYIGFTTKPSRRIRQHNGELKGGAKRTRASRPWEFAVVIGGFADKKVALSFEWHFQHPKKSKSLRAKFGDAEARKLGLKRGPKGKFAVLQSLLKCEPFCNCDELKLYFPTEVGYGMAMASGLDFGRVELKRVESVMDMPFAAELSGVIDCDSDSEEDDDFDHDDEDENEDEDEDESSDNNDNDDFIIDCDIEETNIANIIVDLTEGLNLDLGTTRDNAIELD
ncbi:hypothetical protein ScalyP_jg7400 [Parmales sp. scaly parma]|nr:hypothetical protein ScalyP_jg7400 [Parmales sp. scaly parma]